MARIVIRRSRIPDQSAPVEARPPWTETIAAGGAAPSPSPDYHLIPRRFTPGFELCLSRHSFPWIYGALAVGFILPEALTGTRQRTPR